MSLSDRITFVSCVVAFVSLLELLGAIYRRKTIRALWEGMAQMRAQIAQLRDVVGTWQTVIDALSAQQRQTLAISHNGRQTAYETDRHVKKVIGSVNTILVKICDILHIPPESIDEPEKPAAQRDSDGGSPPYSFDGSTDTGTFAPDGQRSDHPPSLRET